MSKTLDITSTKNKNPQMNIEIEVKIGKNEHDYHPVKSKSTLNVEGIDDNVVKWAEVIIEEVRP